MLFKIEFDLVHGLENLNKGDRGVNPQDQLEALRSLELRVKELENELKEEKSMLRNLEESKFNVLYSFF